MKVRRASLSNGLKPVFGASDAIAPVAVPGAEDATGPATGFGLADIPILPVKESSNPPTDGDTFTITSGSTTSPETMSLIACATTNAL